jgi:hypothetical protein
MDPGKVLRIVLRPSLQETLQSHDDLKLKSMPSPEKILLQIYRTKTSLECSEHIHSHQLLTFANHP